MQMSKYLAKKKQKPEGWFDSEKEYKRFLLLKKREAAGEIQNLERQVKYPLIPTQREPDTVGPRGGIIKGKVIEQGVSYYADFVYQENGQTVVEDVKGYRKGTAYSLYTIKRKLMLYIYKIRIKEV